LFLYSILDEEIYIEQPPNFVSQRESGQVCLLGSLHMGWRSLLEHGLEYLPQLLRSLGFVVLRRIILFIRESKFFDVFMLMI